MKTHASPETCPNEAKGERTWRQSGGVDARGREGSRSSSQCMILSAFRPNQRRQLPDHHGIPARRPARIFSGHDSPLSRCQPTTMSPSASTSSSDSEQSTPPPQSSRKRQHLSNHEPESSSESLSDDSDSSSDSQSDPEDEQEPVLSHAEKRRQKKKAEHTAKKDTRPVSDVLSKKGKEKMKNTAELPPSKLPKRQNSIWVGNLSFKTTPASLRAFFEGAGEVTRIHLPMKMAQGGPESKGPRKENRGSVLTLPTQSCIRRMNNTSVLLLQFCVCGLCYTGRKNCRHNHVRESSRGTSSADQRWYVPKIHIPTLTAQVPL